MFFIFDKVLAVGSNVIWDGKANNNQFVLDGTYFYKAVFTLDEFAVDCEKQVCKIEESGFITVIK